MGLRNTVKKLLDPPKEDTSPSRYPVIGQIVRHTLDGTTLIVTGMRGIQSKPPVLVNLLVQELLKTSQKDPFDSPMLNLLAQGLSALQYTKGSILLSDGSAHFPSPWPPEGMEVVGQLAGTLPGPWFPRTPEAQALAKAQEEDRAAKAQEAQPD